jgi:hypothetical protein
MPIFYFGSVSFISSWKFFFFYGGIGTVLQEPPPPPSINSSSFTMTSKKNRRNNVASKDDHRRRMRLMTWDSPLLTGGNLGRRSPSRSHGRSPRGAGHDSWGNCFQKTPGGTTVRMTFHALAKQQQTTAAHQHQADEATRATALAAKTLANEGERADMFAAAHCQAMATAECQSQEDKAACRKKGSALRAPAPVRTQAAAACQERGSALCTPAPAWAKTEAERPWTLAEAAGYDGAKCVSAFTATNCRAEAKADRQAQAVLAEQQHQADEATHAHAVANEAQQEVKGAKCAQHLGRLPLLNPARPRVAWIWRLTTQRRA